MKLLCILFSLLVIFLSVKPCCTDCDCDAVSKTEQTGKGKDCAGCSSFFSCGTCAGFTIAATIPVKFSLGEGSHNTTYPAYQQDNFKDVVLSIWQPPQLA